MRSLKSNAVRPFALYNPTVAKTGRARQPEIYVADRRGVFVGTQGYPRACWESGRWEALDHGERTPGLALTSPRRRAEGCTSLRPIPRSMRGPDWQVSLFSRRGRSAGPRPMRHRREIRLQGVGEAAANAPSTPRSLRIGGDRAAASRFCPPHASAALGRGELSSSRTTSRSATSWVSRASSSLSDMRPSVEAIQRCWTMIAFSAVARPVSVR